MDILSRDSGGDNVVAREQALARFYAPATAETASVEVYMRLINEDSTRGVWNLLGTFAPTAKVSVPYNPTKDQRVELATRAYSASGVPDVSYIEDAVAATLIHQRETEAPVIGQVGDATPESVTVGVSGFTSFARRRRLSVAEALVGGELDNPTVAIFEPGNEAMPIYIDISRIGAFASDFSWAGNDPAANGFTLTGAAPAETDASGWRINSAGTNAATYYTKTGWPGGAFAAGFTLDLPVPIVMASDNANPAQCVAVRVEDGTHRYELTFDADEVKLNGGASHIHAGGRIRLVIAAGGLTADLWIGDTLTENNTAFQATGTSGLSFGDLAGADDADAVWPSLAYSLTPVPVRLAQTIYVTVAHSSGGAWTPDSNILELTFANEGSAEGGSLGDFDPTPRDTYQYEPV